MIVSGAKRLNYNTAALLRAADLSEGKCERLPPEKVTQLIQSVWQVMNDEFMGFTQLRCKQGVFAIMARQAIQCQTLREALIQGAHFYQTIRNDISFVFEENDDGAVLSFSVESPELDPDNFLTEFFLLVWHRFSIWLVGQKVPLKYANFSYPSPEHVKEYSLLLPCHCRFNQNENSIVFESSALSLPIKQKERELKEFLKNSPANLLSKPMFHSTFTTQVMNFIGESTIEAMPRIEEVASYFNMSSRNLRRRLKEENSSYQAIKDTLRKNQSMKLLNNKTLAINQVAREVGFNEPAGFTRAFKQWTGQTPKQFRDDGIAP